MTNGKINCFIESILLFDKLKLIVDACTADAEPTKSKDDVVYTIKEDFMDKPQIENRLSAVIRDIEQSANPAAKKRGDNKWIMLDQDSYFGTMGGFHWDIKKLPNGNYQAYANDTWDLQPFKHKNGLLRNLEVGKALGIGKPLNVKVGFEIDKDTKKILKTYGMAPGAVAGAAAAQEKKQMGGSYQTGGTKTYLKGGLKNRVLYNKAKYKR